MLALYDYQLLNHSLVLSALLFSVGLVGLTARRSLPAILVSAGIMLQGAIMALAAFGTFHGAWSGYVFAMLALIATVAIGVIAAAMMPALLRAEGSLDAARLRSLAEETDNRQRPSSGTVDSSVADADALVTAVGSERSDD